MNSKQNNSRTEAGHCNEKFDRDQMHTYYLFEKYILELWVDFKILYKCISFGEQKC